MEFFINDLKKLSINTLSVAVISVFLDLPSLLNQHEESVMHDWLGGLMLLVLSLCLWLFAEYLRGVNKS